MSEEQHDWSEEEEDWNEDTDGNEGDTPERTERMRIVTDKRQEPLRIDKFLTNRVEGATRNKMQQGLEEGNITVNGQIVSANYKIKPGDDIIIYETRRAESQEVLPEPLPLNIVYEDADLMIINKAPGMVVHPGCGNYNGTLINGIAWHLQQEGVDTTGMPRVGLVHRIDKDTSGLLVIAKSENAMSNLAAQFKKHTVHRRYIALVWGDVAAEAGTIAAHVGRNQRFRKIMAAYPDGEYGKEAITHYKVLERFGYVTLLELRLETGRTHQIRVHMQSQGHPLFNDATYGGDRIVKGTIFAKYRQFVENCFKAMPRHALHAKELGFRHPHSGEGVLFDSALPEDLETVLGKWRSYTSGMTSQLRQGLDG